MNKPKIGLILFLIVAIAGFLPSYSLPFLKKKQNIEEEQQEPMVHTVDEWLETATSVNMQVREEMKDPFLEEDAKIIPPPEDIPEYIEPYNITAGSKELDLTLLNKQKIVRSPFVASPDFKVAGYTETYLYPQTKQIASAIFLLDLDRSLSNKESLKNANVFENERHLLITTALPYFYDGFFSTLTIVDFSNDGKKILVKEKRGSVKNGLYETYVWVYYISKEEKINHPAYLMNYTRNDARPSFDDLESGTMGGFNIPNGEYGANLGNLKGIPLGNILNNRKSGANALNGNSLLNGANAKGEEGGHSDPLSKNKNNGDNEEYNSKNQTPYDFSAPKLSYKDLKGILTATWKDMEMNSGLNSRWYNQVPDNYKANYDIGEKEKIGFGIRLNLLNDIIKSYWFDKKKLLLNSIRWDLKPLGFNREDSDEIIIDAFAYTKDGKTASLGRWAVNVNDGIPRLVDIDEKITIEANAFWLVKKLNPRK